ncbi:hypothetical protein SELMODRAFT_68366, partial [Selaginella moellendorffii]
QAISDDSKLACIHDSARPLVLGHDKHRVYALLTRLSNTQTVRVVFRDAWVHGAAVLGVRVKATIKEVRRSCSGLIVNLTTGRKRSLSISLISFNLQAIEPSLIRKGFGLVERDGLEVTDDVSIVEFLKRPVFITERSYSNLKVS